jgi:hypothetical protein
VRGIGPRVIFSERALTRMQAAMVMRRNWCSIVPSSLRSLPSRPNILYRGMADRLAISHWVYEGVEINSCSLLDPRRKARA